MFLDTIDKSILNQLQTDASISNLALSSIVGLSAPACFKRVKKLEKEGIIDRKVILLNQHKLGPCLHMIVEVCMHQDRSDLAETFTRRARNAPEVNECYQVTGEVDFVLIVTVKDMPSYEDFCNRVIYAEPNMKNFRTLISMNRVKYDTKTLV